MPCVRAILKSLNSVTVSCPACECASAEAVGFGRSTFVTPRASGAGSTSVITFHLRRHGGATAHGACDEGGFNAFRDKFFPSLGQSRVYELLAIGTGKKTVEETRADKRPRRALPRFV
jgi:hypothetical protein